MSIKDAIAQLQTYNGPLGLTLHNGASAELITKVESTYSIILPTDLKILYSFTDGFETEEDIFNLIPLAEIIDNKENNKPLYIAEYMIYSDMWELEIDPENTDNYSISSMDPQYGRLFLTNSLGEFIFRFLKGGVFEIGGLCAWADEIKAKLYGNTDPVKIKSVLWVYRECLIRGLMTKENVVDRAEWIIATEDKPDQLFIEMSLCSDLNDLINILSSVRFTEDVLQVRAFFGVIDMKLLIDKITTEEVMLILNDLSQDMRFTRYERNKMTNLISTSKRVYIAKKRARQKLRDDVNDFFENYRYFNLYHSYSWEKINIDLINKFESCDT